MMQHFEQRHLLARGINTRKLVCLAWTWKTYSGVREGALQVQVQVCTTPFSGQKEFNVSQIRDTCNRDLQTATTSEKNSNKQQPLLQEKKREKKTTTDRADRPFLNSRLYLFPPFDCTTVVLSCTSTSWGTCHNLATAVTRTMALWPMGNHIQKCRRYRLVQPVQRCTQGYPCCILTRTVTRTLRNFQWNN